MAFASTKRATKAICVGLCVAGAVGAFVACVGDDPAPPTPQADGGGAGDGATASAEGAANDSSSGGTPDASGGPDTSTALDAGDAGDAGSISTFDAGPPIWNATLPAGTQSNLTSASTLKCMFQIVSVQTAQAPPKWELYLTKTDAPGGICNEPKGARALGSGYSQPAASLLRRIADDRFVAAYSMKLGLSGSSPDMLTMIQFDSWSGNDMHIAIMKTKALVGMPVTPSLDVVQLFFGDPTEEAAGTVRLKGTGAFPGETTPGTFFYAEYIGFISSVGQLPTAADECKGGN